MVTILLLSRDMLEDPFGTNPLTRKIIGCGIQVHTWVGPGVYENVYFECLDYELREHAAELPALESRKSLFELVVGCNVSTGCALGSVR